MFTSSAMKRSSDDSHAAISTRAAASAAAQGISGDVPPPIVKKAKEDIVISLLSEDEDEEAAFQQYCLSDDEIEIVSPDKTSSFMQLEGVGDEEVNVIGQQNVLRLPHARNNCTEHSFTHVRPMTFTDFHSRRKDIAANELHCDMCYCYVCDDLASKCIKWTAASLHSFEFSGLPHCLASDGGEHKHLWKAERENHKKRKNLGALSVNLATNQNRLMAEFNNWNRKPAADPLAFTYAVGKGPWPPTDTKAAEAQHLVQCRKCKWFNAMRRDLASKPEVISSECWCHACGRVASQAFFDKEQAVTPPPPRIPVGEQSDLAYLGKRTIGFRLHSHDPTKMASFRDRWASEGWTLDKNEMDEDTFHQRLGQRPLLKNILKLIPTVPHDKIPVDGRIRNHTDSINASQLIEFADNQIVAILLDDANHKALLEELLWQRFNEAKSADKVNKSFAVSGGITASWNKTERKGELEISVYLTEKAFLEHSHSWPNPSHVGSTLSRFLAAWYGVSFRLHELLSAKAVISRDSEKEWPLIGTNNSEQNKASAAERKKLLKAAAQQERDSVSEYNDIVARKQALYSFQSSAGNDTAGGICRGGTSFRETLRRYFAETVIEDAKQSYAGLSNFSWYARAAGVAGHDNTQPRYRHHSKFATYLNPEDHALLMQNATTVTNSVWQRTKTCHGLLQQLENLGHEPAPHVDGLNVELLGFQKQAVGWAIQRENLPGGIQSLLWTKLPVTNGRTPDDLWFNPILDCVSKTPPKCVRGGFICHEMGLGKTVISLAVVLQNPAPNLPLSGTKVLDNVTFDGWSQLERADGRINSSYASIYSRATLVICSVSLVGQWIDEARSKLKDPGLVYAYYGGSRKRNAALLSKNAIVVTTYGTIQSDCTYWSQKSDTPGYVPPCEQIYWWRVICDESHMLRNGSNSCSQIPAVNRWAVTGTPINTRVTDLKEQMKFIGFDHVESYFRRCESLWLSHNMQTSTASRRARYGNEHMFPDAPIGNFLFLFREMLMRHTMKMTIRGSNIDIMSLPPKSERVVEVNFSSDERSEYKSLEAVAVVKYKSLRNSYEFGKHYLAILQLLTPVRLACAGGTIEEKVEPDNNAKNPYVMKDDDALECSICLDLLQDGRATVCNHLFCRECIVGVIDTTGEREGPCPLCREPVVVQNLRPIVMPKAKVEENGEACGIKSSFVFDSKLKFLLEQLTHIRDNDPTSKSLIFSQFQSTLKWLQMELPKHGFQFRTLSGDMSMPARAKALREFQSDPPTTVFLLSLRAGAVGINLTQANRVFIMEPAYNPALEAQAIGRVHRLGQTRNVEIIRLIVKDSFESRLLELFKNGGANNSDNGDGSTDDLNNDGEGIARATAPEQSTSSSSSKGNIQLELVGNLVRDRPKLGKEEFDQLFNISDS